MKSGNMGRTLLLALFGCSIGLLAFWLTSHGRRGSRVSENGSATQAEKSYASGRYLVIYAFVAKECGLCREEKTRQALARLRQVVVLANKENFAEIRVIGVALDDDVSEGVSYLKSLETDGRIFDQISVGGGWLNEQVAGMVWREHQFLPRVPQVVGVVRRIDASAYPSSIAVQPDSLLFVVTGRDSLLKWIGGGGRL